MEKAKSFFAILGLGAIIGIVIVVILLFVVRATPKSVTVGGVEFEIPTPTIVQIQEPTNISPAIIPSSTAIPQIQATNTL